VNTKYIFCCLLYEVLSSSNNRLIPDLKRSNPGVVKVMLRCLTGATGENGVSPGSRCPSQYSNRVPKELNCGMLQMHNLQAGNGFTFILQTALAFIIPIYVLLIYRQSKTHISVYRTECQQFHSLYIVLSVNNSSLCISYWVLTIPFSVYRTEC
jgi:hypothetical protein